MQKREEAVLDIECYRDYFLVMFSHMDRTPFKGFELYEGHPLDRRAIIKLLKKYTVVTFNGRNYDIPLLMLALASSSVDNQQLKAASDHIIQGNLKPWEFEEQYGVTTHPSIDHIDLIEVAKGQASLKIYGGRIHCRLMQDLPYHFDDYIMEEPGRREVVFNYCGNDLETTKGLRRKLGKQIDLRIAMSQEYEIDLRSKSDAQIAEAVIRKRIEVLTGRRVYKPKGFTTTSFTYKTPPFIRFKTPLMQNVLGVIEQATFRLDGGKVAIPDKVAKLAIQIGNSHYKIGNGGLHSQESCIAHEEDYDHVLCDRDVRSYYPSIILESKLFPEHLGEPFLRVLRDIYNTRLAAKDAGNTVIAETLKIVLNGSFGKFGSQWSVLFAPNLLIQTTVTGQLALLMLIEAFELSGIAVVSANTDGVVVKCPRDKIERMEEITRNWEKRTRFVMETTWYQAIYSRDVNNYFAVKHDGSVKRKGAYSPAGVDKNPTVEICSDAVAELLSKGTPLDDTILWCDDIRKMISIKKVAGGGQQQSFEHEVDDWVQVADRQWARQAWIDEGHGAKATVKRKSRPAPVMVGGGFSYLGKAVRFYYSKNSPGPITYASNGNKVGDSDGAMALMTLPDHMPTDVDFDWYLDRSRRILREIGAADMADGL